MRTSITANKISRHSPLVSTDGGFPNGVDSDPDNGHSIIWVRTLLIYITSDSDSPQSVSFHVSRRVDDLAVEDLVVWVPSQEGAIVGPFSSDYVNSGKVEFDVSGDAGDLAFVGLYT